MKVSSSNVAPKIQRRGAPSRPPAAAFTDGLRSWMSLARIQITSDETFPRLAFPAGMIVVTKGMTLSRASAYALALNGAAEPPMPKSGWTVLSVPSSQGRLPKEGSEKPSKSSMNLREDVTEGAR